MKIYSLSVKQLLHYVNIAAQAALSVPELREQLKAHSMDEKKIRVGLKLAEQVTIWQERQEATLEQARQAQRSFEDVQRSIRALYQSHRETARFVYRREAEPQQKLQLRGSGAARYAEWLSQTRQFYAHLDAKVMAKYGVPAAEISEVKKLLGQLLELEVLRNDAKRQAQQATQGKQAAVQELRSWFSRFMRVARLACADDPQLLEAMGVVVPS